MFPDAVTVRGRRHIDELSRLSGSGIAGPDVGTSAAAGANGWLTTSSNA